MMVTTDWYWRLFLVIVFHRTQGPKTTVKTESSVLLHGCFLATVSSSKHQTFDPSITMPCINCGPCIPYTLKCTNLQPPTYPSTLKFAKLLFAPSLLQVAALRTTSQRKDSTEHLEIPRISSTEFDPKIQGRFRHMHSAGLCLNDGNQELCAWQWPGKLCPMLCFSHLFSCAFMPSASTSDFDGKCEICNMLVCHAVIWIQISNVTFFQIHTFPYVSFV